MADRFRPIYLQIFDFGILLISNRYFCKDMTFLRIKQTQKTKYQPNNSHQPKTKKRAANLSDLLLFYFVIQ
jgi:hypothetical protein